jgi:hypothetical protein
VTGLGVKMNVYRVSGGKHEEKTARKMWELMDEFYGRV